MNEDISTIEQYTARTGKRFRMTKQQRDSGVPRSVAFAEFIAEFNRKYNKATAS